MSRSGTSGGDAELPIASVNEATRQGNRYALGQGTPVMLSAHDGREVQDVVEVASPANSALDCGVCWLYCQDTNDQSDSPPIRVTSSQDSLSD